MKKSIMTQYLAFQSHQYILPGACRDFNMLYMLFNDFFTSKNLFWEINNFEIYIHAKYINVNDLHRLSNINYVMQRTNL